uniref:Uncharacterized protein n=1 Tax=Haematobia irritans TaxID=7368 RepID=A0A1L8E5X3_HAEIR
MFWGKRGNRGNTRRGNYKSLFFSFASLFAISWWILIVFTIAFVIGIRLFLGVILIMRMGNSAGCTGPSMGNGNGSFLCGFGLLVDSWLSCNSSSWYFRGSTIVCGSRCTSYGIGFNSSCSLYHGSLNLITLLMGHCRLMRQ